MKTSPSLPSHGRGDFPRGTGSGAPRRGVRRPGRPSALTQLCKKVAHAIATSARRARPARSQPRARASAPADPPSAGLTPRPPGRRGNAGPHGLPPPPPAPESRRSAPPGAEAGREEPPLLLPAPPARKSARLPKFRARADVPSPRAPEPAAWLRLAPIHPAKVNRWEGGRPRLARNVRRSRTQTMLPPPSACGPPPSPASRAAPRAGNRLPGPGPHCCPARAMPGVRGRSPRAVPQPPPAVPQPPPAAGAGSAHTFPS
ncbi:basic proline-rich protein-like [Kogia breviceps]|uniref:basic proline-rich protein-like n=1 Tax=Kogia breviceps TaxID=27615 RepID=UPI002795D7FE|nr:basic proline-rich protein-like [Kogia breviceps]